MPPLQRGLVVISFAVVTRGQFHLFVRNLSIRNLAQEMGNAVEPGSFFIIGADYMPR